MNDDTPSNPVEKIITDPEREQRKRELQERAEAATENMQKRISGKKVR